MPKLDMQSFVVGWFAAIMFAAPNIPTDKCIKPTLVPAIVSTKAPCI